MTVNETLERKPDRRRGGFTLMEILVAVAILAILSAALAPLVIKNVNDGRRARALSDARVIADAIRAFNLDTGRWPVAHDTNPNGELSRLVGLEAGYANGDIPGGTGSETGAGNWNGGGSGGGLAASGSLQSHLILNQNSGGTELYTASASPPQPPGWNGPYLDDVPLDPWGNPYVCNVRYLQNANVGGVTQDEADRHAVYCLSAGSNGLFETSFDDATELDNTPAGDDVGAMVQGCRLCGTPP